MKEKEFTIQYKIGEFVHVINIVAETQERAISGLTAWKRISEKDIVNVSSRSIPCQNE